MSLKKLDKTKLVKELARDTLGQPKPTTVRHSRKAGAARNPVDSPSGHYLSMGNYRETPIEGGPRLAQVRPVHSALPSVQPRHWHEIDTGIVYSQEVKQHCAYLEKTAGAEAVKQYLDAIRHRRGEHMAALSSTEIAEKLSRNNDEPARPAGSLESALHDAREKQRYFLGELQRYQDEANRWGQIADNLQSTLKLLDAPAGSLRRQAASEPTSVVKKSYGKRVDRDQQLRNFFREVGGNKPIKKEGFFHAFAEYANISITRVYPAMLQLRKKGVLMELVEDGETKMALTEWTEPAVD